MVMVNVGKYTVRPMDLMAKGCMGPFRLSVGKPVELAKAEPRGGFSVRSFFEHSEDQQKHQLGGGFKYFYFHPYLGKIPILTNIF